MLMVNPPRSRFTPKAVDDVLSDPKHALGALFRHARGLARLEEHLARYTGPDTAQYFQVANVRENRMILLTPTAAWATRLRMMAPQLIAFLNRSGFEAIRHIDIRVAPLARESVEPRRTRAQSPAARQAMEQMRKLSRRET